MQILDFRTGSDMKLTYDRLREMDGSNLGSNVTFEKELVDNSKLLGKQMEEDLRSFNFKICIVINDPHQ